MDCEQNRLAHPEPEQSTEITVLLKAWNQGDPMAMNQLIQIVYNDLRKTARFYFRAASAGQTLQPTALVHEVYAHLMKNRDLVFHNREHFFRCACLIMRQTLMQQARMHKTLKRGNGVLSKAISPDEIPDFGVFMPDPDTLLILDQALTNLFGVDTRKHQILELRFFVGLNLEEIALVLNVSARTVKREWRTTKQWLARELKHLALEENHRPVSSSEL